MPIPFLASMGLQAGAALLGYGAAKKQKKALEGQLAGLKEEQELAIERSNVSTGVQESRLESEIGRQRVAASARDPFMEAAVGQGAFQRATADQRKAEVAAGGQAQRIRQNQVVQGQLRGQALMQRQSGEIQRQKQMADLTMRATGQLNQVTQAGFQAQESIRSRMGARIDSAQGAINEMGDPLSTMVGGLVSGMAGGAGGVTGGMQDLFSSLGMGDNYATSQAKQKWELANPGMDWPGVGAQ